MNEMLKKLVLRKLAQDQQNEPKETNEFMKGEEFRERDPVEPENIQEKEPMQLAQEEPSRWQKLMQFVRPAPEPTQDPKEQMTEKLNKILSGKERDEQIRKQLETTK